MLIIVDTLPPIESFTLAKRTVTFNGDQLSHIGEVAPTELKTKGVGGRNFLYKKR
jgi:hypothetical protein